LCAYPSSTPQVLAAARRTPHTGVLFLGDFWHARGALPVTLLNSVLEVLGDWDVPLLMLPGNHDQVSLGGEEHALTPLGAARRDLVHVFSKPTYWRGALWLPYRRDSALLQAALGAVASDAGLRCVFAHADVAGALMNEAHQAREGLSPALFPAHVPTYTGHYHVPHTVAGTRITYVGSPYQVSMSEAGQTKRLLVLDGEWGQLAQLPLDIGPRHFQLEGAEAAPPPSLRPGDRVRWNVAADNADPAAAAAVAASVAELRASGVDVTLSRAPGAGAAPRIADAEALNPAGLLHAYARAAALPPPVTAACDALLSRLSTSGAAALARPHVDFAPTRLSLRGFGPFKDAQDYPLHRRGFVVVSGRNLDAAESADSNGAGKTSLVMALLWALQGSAGNGGSGGKSRTSAQFVADGCKQAFVRLEGTLNGQAFWCERAASKTKLLSFRWGLGHTEHSCAEAKLTAAALDEVLPLQLLRSTSFHGQHDMEALLSSSDKELKETLGHLVSLHAWTAAEEAAKAEGRQQEAQLRQRQGGLGAMQQGVAREAANVLQAQRKRQEWEERHAADVELAAVAACSAGVAYSSEAASLRAALAELRAAWEWGNALVDKASADETDAKRAAQQAQAASVDEEGVRSQYAQQKEAANQALAHAAERQARCVEETLRANELAAEAAAAHRFAQKALDAFQGVVLTPSSSSGRAPPHQHPPDAVLGTCAQCLQPIDARHFTRQAGELEAAAAELLARAAAARSALADAQAAAAAAKQQHTASQQALAGVAAEETRAWKATQAKASADQAQAQQRADAARADCEALSGAVKAGKQSGMGARDTLKELGEDEELPPRPTPQPASVSLVCEQLQKAQMAVVAQERALRRAVTVRVAAAARLLSLQEAVNPEASALEAALRRQHEAAADLTSAEAALADAEASVLLSDAVADALGTKGIQAYLFDDLLRELEERTAQHLRQLTGGTMDFTLRSDESKSSAAAKKKMAKKKGAGAQPADAEHQASPPEDSLAVAKETVMKRVWALADVGGPAGAEPVERSIEQLSGGERRRVSLALTLAFNDLAASRGGLRCELLVLDEALQHLDPEGVARVSQLLKSRTTQQTVLLTSQAASKAVSLADAVDYVVKQGHRSTVEVAGGLQAPRLFPDDASDEDA